MLFLAIRQLLARKKQTFFIFLGIVSGTLVYVFVAGIQLGFRQFFIEQLVNNDAHVKVTAHEEVITKESMLSAFYPKYKGLVNWITPPSGRRGEAHILSPQSWFNKLDHNPLVMGYSQIFKTQGLATLGEIKVPVQLSGVMPDKQLKITTLGNYIKEGKFESIGASGNRIVVGSGVLQKLGARVSQTVMLTVGSSTQPFKIVGSFNLGVQQIDDLLVYGALRDFQQLNGTPGRITDISVMLFNVDLAAPTATQWALESHDKVQSWDQANANILEVFKIQDIFRAFITGSVLLISAFGIYNVLSITINQKKKEIAILRSLGFPPREILILFLFQGVILGIAGALIGSFLGFLLCKFLEGLDLNVMGRKGFIISYASSIYITGFVMAVLSSLLASFLPARAASQMTPIDIIRQES